MELIVVERSFEAPADLDGLTALEAAVAWCLEQRRVRFLFSYMSRDGRHMTCFYEAPDAEAVRFTQDTGKLPYELIWPARELPVGPPPALPEGYATVLVQRALPRVLDEEEILALMRAADGCMQNNRATLRQSFYSPSVPRMLCCIQAPDAESVRRANIQADLPMVRAWPATFHPA